MTFCLHIKCLVSRSALKILESIDRSFLELWLQILFWNINLCRYHISREFPACSSCFSSNLFRCWLTKVILLISFSFPLREENFLNYIRIPSPCQPNVLTRELSWFLYLKFIGIRFLVSLLYYLIITDF